MRDTPFTRALAAAQFDCGGENKTDLNLLWEIGVNDGLEKAARICECEAVMFDIQGAHATATHCAEQIRKVARET